jgi:hypothetical protein
MIASCSARSGSITSLPQRPTGDDPECESVVEDNVAPQTEFGDPRCFETPARDRDSKHERFCDLDTGRKEHGRCQADISRVMTTAGATIVLTATGRAYQDGSAKPRRRRPRS